MPSMSATRNATVASSVVFSARSATSGAHGALVERRSAEIEPREPRQPRAPLHDERPIESGAMLGALDRRLACAEPHRRLHHVAGREARDEEGGGGHADDEQERGGEAAKKARGIARGLARMIARAPGARRFDGQTREPRPLR